MIKYPVGIQTFSEIRNGGYLYIDKTQYIYDMCHPGKYVFLSRPRRFGKSLLTSTLEAYLSGRRKLFKGLAIDQLETEWNQHPVLHFDMGHVADGRVVGFHNYIDSKLTSYEKDFNVTKEYDSPAVRLANIIHSIYRQTKKQVVVLIDNYDAPLLKLKDKSLIEPIWNELQSFYCVLKELDPYLMFLYFTGMTKFAFLNNLEDVTMYTPYSAICGITQEELETNFQEGIAQLTQKYRISSKDLIKKLKSIYGGYRFTAGNEILFNPSYLMRAFSDGELGNYWSEDDTHAVSARQIDDYFYSPLEFDNRKDSHMVFYGPFNEFYGQLPFLYENGYLTIKDYNKKYRVCTLGFPNETVKVGINFSTKQRTIESWKTVEA